MDIQRVLPGHRFNIHTVPVEGTCRQERVPTIATSGGETIIKALCLTVSISSKDPSQSFQSSDADANIMTDGQLRASLQPNRLSLIIADLHTTKRLGEQRSTGSSLGGCYGGGWAELRRMDRMKQQDPALSRQQAHTLGGATVYPYIG